MTVDTPTKKLPWYEVALCAWPMWLVVAGGALGGACGGASWAVNDQIMKSGRPAAQRYALVFASGTIAALLFFGIVSILAVVFPQLFGR